PASPPAFDFEAPPQAATTPTNNNQRGMGGENASTLVHGQHKIADSTESANLPARQLERLGRDQRGAEHQAREILVVALARIRIGAVVDRLRDVAFHDGPLAAVGLHAARLGDLAIAGVDLRAALLEHERAAQAD